MIYESFGAFFDFSFNTICNVCDIANSPLLRPVCKWYAVKLKINLHWNDKRKLIYLRKKERKYHMPNIKPISELELMTELEKGERSAREEGWLSADEVETSLGLKGNMKNKEN